VCMLIAMVFITEMFNTAIERIVDYISPEISDMARHCKDLSAAAVLVAAIIAFIAGVVIFLPKLLLLIG
jgi:diacylglycerol kinase